MKKCDMLVLSVLLSFFFSSTATPQEWTDSTDLSAGPASAWALDAVDNANIWAVLSKNGKIFHYDGAIWELQTAAFAVQTGILQTVSAADDSHAWAVGYETEPSEGGRIFFYDGTWHLQTALPGSDYYVYGIYAANSSTVCAVGSGGYIYHSWDGGSTWSVGTRVADTYDIRWVDGVDGTHIWALGQPDYTSSRIFFYDGADWTLQSTIVLAGGERLWELAAAGPAEAWAAGENGWVFHYSGGMWAAETDLDGAEVKGLDVAPNGDLWACTQDGSVFRYNGTRWTQAPQLYAGLISLTASAPSRIWVGNSASQIFYYPVSAPPPWIHDYNGDGTSEVAIFRGSSGLWAIRGVTRAYFGGSSDEAVPGDFNGDGTTDIGIFRASSGLWAIRDVSRVYFGSSADNQAQGDYNGDGTDEIGIFRPSSGLWALRGVSRVYFGTTGDTPAPGDFNGDGTKDIGIYRSGAGLWAIRGVTRAYFGGSTDETVPGDYSGIGSWAVGIFRPSTGLWAVKDVTRRYFGTSPDQPSPADYNGDGTDDIGIFRDSSGLWAVSGVTRGYFGGGGDIPVTR